MKVVLVNVGVFQEYIFHCIEQLCIFGNTDITIITNRAFFDKYSSATFAKNIDLISCEELDDMDYHTQSGMSRDFRGGFAFYASQRLFLIYSYMQKYGIENCAHIENDNMVYENLDNIFPGSPKPTKLCAVFDSKYRVIPGILYIPTSNALYEILRSYRPQFNDMENLGMRADAIEKLPIIPRIDGYNDPNYAVGLPYAQNFGRFGAKHIFDGAAIGQYLGGIDPRNTTERDTRGFVNETCVIKYNKFEIVWTAPHNDGLFRPYLKIAGEEYPIVNLHIHSKNLKDFLTPTARATQN